MGIVASIVSIVFKTIAGNQLTDGLVKEILTTSIDGISEEGINKITDFVNREKSKIDHILSKEKMRSLNIPDEYIDYVITEIKDLFSKINITDEVIRQCGYNNNELKTFLWNTYKKFNKENTACDEWINICLYDVASVLINLLRESKYFEKDMLILISNSANNIDTKIDKISENMSNNFDKQNNIIKTMFEQIQKGSVNNKETIVKSRTKEYADIWEQNMFLNDFDKWDEKAGVNVKLKDVYTDEFLPHFIWGENKTERADIKALLSEYINKKNENKMLLVLGQPAIGKSTLITWITVNFYNMIDNILIYKFSSDLHNIDWKNERISDRILEELCLQDIDLNGKILILDGFDEVSIEFNRRRKILDNLYDGWVFNKTICNFLFIVTCRENYVPQSALLKCKYITLQPWNETQIRNFCSLFQEKTENIISQSTIEKFVENKEILGIPLILYMTLALNISIEKEGSIVDIYDKIFSLEGGIYDRCIDNKRFADYHRISTIKKQIHQISREIAIWMFENNSEKESIPQKEFEKICDTLTIKHEKDEESIIEDAKIGNFFKAVRNCDGIETDEIRFIHRSIYEYFVMETIYSSIENAMIELSEESKIELAGNIAFYLKKGEISPTIGENLQYKCIKLYDRLNADKKQYFYQWWENAIDKMLDNGLFYYTKRNIQDYKNIIKMEGRCFLNLLVILRSLLPLTNRDYILQDVENDKITDYIGLRHWGDYSKLFLENANLRGKCLHELELSMVCLRKADLRRSDLIGTNLCEADLQDADLRGAELRSTRFKKTILKGAKFNENQIPQLKNYTHNLDDIKIYIEKEDRFIGYDEYMKRNGKLREQ